MLSREEHQAVHQVDDILKAAGLPAYGHLRKIILTLEARELFDHDDSDDDEERRAKLAMRMAARELGAHDLGDIDYEGDETQESASSSTIRPKL